MCNNCIHKAVCGKLQATGGHVRECEHFIRTNQCAFVPRKIEVIFHANELTGTVKMGDEEFSCYVGEMKFHPIRSRYALDLMYKREIRLIEY